MARDADDLQMATRQPHGQMSDRQKWMNYDRSRLSIGDDKRGCYSRRRKTSRCSAKDMLYFRSGKNPER